MGKHSKNPNDRFVIWAVGDHEPVVYLGDVYFGADESRIRTFVNMGHAREDAVMWTSGKTYAQRFPTRDAAQALIDLYTIKDARISDINLLGESS